MSSADKHMNSLSIVVMHFYSASAERSRLMLALATLKRSS